MLGSRGTRRSAWLRRARSAGRDHGLEAEPLRLERAHRDVRGGGLRAAVFGVSDGLVSNVSLVLGTAGAHPGAGVVRLAGLAGLLGGSFSMAAGEYVSMRAQREAFERELEVERAELREQPESERRELERIYRRRGIDAETARRLTDQLMEDPEVALRTHAREELGIDPDALGSPVQAAASSFASFALGAVLPLAPFLGGSFGTAAVVAAIVLTALAALAVGAALALFTARSKLYSALRSLGICAVAGAVTYGVGSLVGVAA
ncbi:MAG TPA: VIT1/CCC1 transporter family protein [Acidimicrobiales bacterium]|nr:VIT1/CCC1 transporter family protein [Acidimicrobiales bacterium]